MVQLVEEIQRIVPNLEVEFHELPQDDPKQRRPDIQRAKKLIDWEPRTSLQTGLAQTIEYFRMELESSSETASN
jgi:UDP-glucuronate decarboxylase